MLFRLDSWGNRQSNKSQIKDGSLEPSQGDKKGKAKEMLKDDQLLGTKKKGETITGETKREGQRNATR